MSDLFKRQTLDQLCDVPEDIIDVYVVERHIWQGGTNDVEADSKRKRRAEPRTIKDFLIDPVRSLLNDVLRQLSAPYDPSTKANPIGQGWWIQAEFGSGKSHLLSFIGALALGDKKVWETVNQLETKNKKGKRESIFQFYDDGLAKKGETTTLADGLTLIRCGGHFEGGTVLHWAGGAGENGALLSGDIIQVVPDRKHVSFMWSYPNYIPLPASTIERIVNAVEPFQYGRIYGAFWDMVIERDGKAVVKRSAERYLRAIGR